MTVRLLAGLMALLVAVQVVRTSLVRAWADDRPAAAAQVWSGHPDTQLALGMTGIATAVSEGKPVAPPVFDKIFAASRNSPLAPEPFLVRGVQAQLSGNARLAEQAFAAAKLRDGRSLPARYFLTEHYLRQRDAARGLREIAALARLVPDGVPKLAPFVARYAEDPKNTTQLRRVLHAEPFLEDTTLSVLATDASNSELIFALSNPQRRSSKSAWLPGLLDSLIRDRQYEKARRVWAALSGLRLDGGLIFDPQFTRANEPPPFNWLLTSSTVGLAERQRGGGLHIIYYGQEEGPLVSELLILPAGAYRLVTKSTGGAEAETLRWILVCAATNSPIASIPLAHAVSRGWHFDIPADCPAQRLELGGVATDGAQQVDVTIQSVSLTREGSDG